MKKINLKKLRLLNFKGSTPMEIEFSEKTSIYADNAVGKTRIVDAFLWLLFGKDSEDKSDFSIKPLDSKSNPISKVNVEVECILEINSREYQFMKVYKEKWTKKKGELEPELTGHETGYYVDLINVQKKDYENAISGIIDIEVFRLITNPVYFEQKDRMQKRSILFSLVQTINDYDIAASDESLKKLLDSLNGKDMQVYKKSLESQIRLMKNDLDLIPPRIDETLRQRPEQLDFKSIDAELLEKNKELTRLEQESKQSEENWKQKNAEYIKVKHKILSIETELTDIRSKIKLGLHQKHVTYQNDLSAKDSEISATNELIRQLSKDIERDYSDISLNESKLENLRNKWRIVRAEEINIKPEQTICPTCKRELSNLEDVKTELTSNFNADKIERLNIIEKEAGNLSLIISDLQKHIISNQGKIEDLKVKITDLETQKENIYQISNQIKTEDELLKITPEYNDLLAEKEKLEQSLKQPTEEIEKPNLDVLKNEIYALRQKLETEKQIERSNSRIKELEQEMRTKSQEIANLERIVYSIELFTRKKIELIESQINAKFSYVKFKLYNQLINGGEEETCITLINGVPYHSANYASRINAGLDIINILSKHYDIAGPVFVDNAESISELLPMNTQVIRLIKKTGQTKLLVENENKN